MSVEKYRMALAGLLHDIGKFAQRAGEQVTSEWSEGKTRRDFKYQHALHTWHFVNKHVPKEFDIGLLAAYHHAPQNAEQRLIRLADQLSAGERDSGDTARDDGDRKAHPKQLHPIFAQITLNGQAHPEAGKHDRFFLPLGELRLEEKRIFPEQAPMTEEEVWRTYDEMWKAFTKAAERLKASVEAGEMDLPAYVEAMQALMMRYTWSIPAAYWKTYADTSLYDHSRMTAALAVALADFDDAQIGALNHNWQMKGGEMWDKPVALLVGGDISGVQNFIYTISSKGAAKALRGRSFYLQLLTEAVLRFVLRELGLPTTSVIYSGGGHFFLLAPLSAEEELPEIQAAISRKLLTHHGTSLYLALGSAKVPLAGFRLGRFTDYWGLMQKNLQEAKSRRYAELGLTMHEWVFAVPKDGGGDKHCVVCGADDVHLTPWNEEKGEGDAESPMICSQCRSYVEDLGADLPRTTYLRWHWGKPQDTSRKTFVEALQAFGAEIQLVKRDKKSGKVEVVEAAPGDTLWALDDPEGNWPRGSETAARWLRYTVNQIPMEGEQPITFDKLQEKSGSGFERLGVVRMDVDNLGDMFKDGFKRKKKDGSEENIATLSRLSALSSAMSLYFEGWVKRIIARDGRDTLVYAVYAGGDDVFLLGPWDVMPDVALDIEREFEAYTRHPGLHLSGGMAFINGKYPVYQAAEDAGEAEEVAKARKITKNGKVIEEKNAFAFLNIAWRWDEFERLKKKKEELVQLVKGTEEASGSPKSILMLLRLLAQMESEAASNRGRPVWGRWMWMAAYHLTRSAERYDRKNPTLAQAMRKMRKEFEENQYRDLPQWGAAARWAQLLLRKGK